MNILYFFNPSLYLKLLQKLLYLPCSGEDRRRFYISVPQLNVGSFSNKVEPTRQALFIPLMYQARGRLHYILDHHRNMSFERKSVIMYFRPFSTMIT